MVTSVRDQTILNTLANARTPTTRQINVDGTPVEIRRPFPSPEDWRDEGIYFLMIDRFNNPGKPPKNLPFDAKFGGFQGGTLKGIRQKLGYIKSLGAGAVWITPVFQNNLSQDDKYHGYGFPEFA